MMTGGPPISGNHRVYSDSYRLLSQLVWRCLEYNNGYSHSEDCPVRTIPVEGRGTQSPGIHRRLITDEFLGRSLNWVRLKCSMPDPCGSCQHVSGSSLQSSDILHFGLLPRAPRASFHQNLGSWSSSATDKAINNYPLAVFFEDITLSYMYIHSNSKKDRKAQSQLTTDNLLRLAAATLQENDWQKMVEQLLRALINDQCSFVFFCLGGCWSRLILFYSLYVIIYIYIYICVMIYIYIKIYTNVIHTSVCIAHDACKYMLRTML